MLPRETRGLFQEVHANLAEVKKSLGRLDRELDRLWVGVLVWIGLVAVAVAIALAR